ncbi:uncharacterized protein (DUF2147 family) [Roseiarcus fermentans]|uniref:Uncharacterized protein (DUF2147 family) n=1 Tax=Roseiarcus fermentans TaxID=1473586 RepID=A0A366FJX9_9HYPH|nr:DUF2147 domain-containing protein [Roseiarcus fermentans]RBP14280.1 uncharacterized protein (DUF2147 family) [Roseiarcus fermentans]
MARVLLGSAAILAVSMSAAAAGDATGLWLRDSGASKVRIAPCGGEALCGSIVWLKDSSGPAKVGQQVFFGMKPHGDNVWTGSAFNPEDGKTYSGKMTLSGDSLTTAGCVLGGLICKSVAWTRAR